MVVNDYNSLTSLPTHVLVEITSYLRPSTLKALCQTHQTLREIAEIHLYKKIRLPLSNPHFPIETPKGIVMRPTKPFLAHSLEEMGWREDRSQSGHLDSSLLYLIPLLKGRERYVRELDIDLKDRYHDYDLDCESLSHPIDTARRPSPTITTIEPKPPNDPISELDQLRIHLSLLRQIESPLHNPFLANTFKSFPILPGITKLRITIYESYPGYLPYLLPLLPNLSELVIQPHELLIESPLQFLNSLMGVGIPKLKRLKIEPMLDCLRGLVEDWVRDGRVEELTLEDMRGGRGWTMDEQLARAIVGSRSLRKIEVGKNARKVLDTIRVVGQ